MCWMVRHPEGANDQLCHPSARPDLSPKPESLRPLRKQRWDLGYLLSAQGRASAARLATPQRLDSSLFGSL